MKKLIFLLLLIACTVQIDTTIKQGNESFVIGNGTTALVITHGLGASPYEVRGLAEYLAKRNITVYGVRLDGHGTSKEDLATKTWQDWYKNYRDAYLSVKPLKQKVFIGGMSMGGAVALKLAEDENVDGVIALAPALILDDSRSNYAWLFKYFTQYSSRIIPNERKPYYYSAFPVAAVAESVTMANVVIKDLSKINKPILIMQYTNDTRVRPVSSQLVYDKISSTKKELVWLNGTGHVFLLDDGKEKYFERIYQFIKENS
jgi:carboxylesterase